MHLALGIEKLTNPSANFKRIYVKFILGVGFIALGTGYFVSAGAISVKIIFCWVVGIAYFAYGMYNYRSGRRKADQTID